MDSACALLADVVPVSSQKSAFKIRTKIQPNLAEFWVAIFAGPELSKFAQKFNQIWLNFGWQFFGGSRTPYGFGLRIAC